MANNSNFSKLVILFFIPLYCVLSFFLFDFFIKQISEATNTRNNLLSEIVSLEEKMKKEASKSPSIKKEYKEVDPKARLYSEINEINREVEALNKAVENIKISFESDLNKKLEAKLPHASAHKEKIQPELIILKGEEEKTFTGFHEDPDVNAQIEKSFDLKAKLDKNIELINEQAPLAFKALEGYMKVFNETDSEFKRRKEIQWNILDSISSLENSIESLRKQYKELTEKTLKTDTEKAQQALQAEGANYETFETIPLLQMQDLSSMISEQTELISRMSEKLPQVKETMDLDNAVNFYNTKDLDTLSQHFGKKINYKKLISSHDLLTKQKFDAELALKSQILIYMEFASQRRVGIYMDRQFPKATKFSKEYKDPNSFIAYFNVKEFYPANPEASSQFRTDNDLLLLIGNTRNVDGIWIKNPEDSLMKVNFGKFTPEFDCLKGSLFGNPIEDYVFTFEVYQLDFKEEDTK